ncbi:MAG: fatty acid desaturase [Bdellovibrionaceae bacterium]|nr:fatty acid desaturase [Pseudobdellovibrionaceae bacterium]
MNFLKKPMHLLAFLLTAYVVATMLITYGLGEYGFTGHFWTTSTALKVVLYVCLMTHITISCMSLSFHRSHTHKGVNFNKYLDTLMQTWLWLVTSMSKLDWVSVHMYHHIHSDDEKDPHSPKQKGLAHVFLFGAWDYNAAKSAPEVLKIRNRLPVTPYELFISKNLLLGPTFMVFFNLIVFGTQWGTILSVINFLLSPIFAVGGVNAIAHWIGYKNHKTTDNSRNIGFLFPLNFLICGELDHNNHHAHQKSCSFRHKWYEFDIGFFYIKILSYFKLAQIRTVYNPSKFKKELAIKALALLEEDFKERFNQLADELNHNVHDLKEQIAAYFEGKKHELQKPAKQFAKEIKAYLRQQAMVQA